MANLAIIKAEINSNINTNGVGSITGDKMNDVLTDIVTTLGIGYTYLGVASPMTSPLTPDRCVFYLAQAGTYTNFGDSFTVPDGGIGVFLFNGSWSKSYINLSDDITAIVSAMNLMMMKGNLPSGSLGDVRTTGTYLLISENSYTDVPANSNAGFLRVSVIGNHVLQEFYRWSGAKIYKRRFNVNDVTAPQWDVNEDGLPEFLGECPAKNFKSVELSPSSTVAGKVFYTDGSLNTNASFTIYKYAVTPNTPYSFTNRHSSSVNVPFVGWADSGGNFIGYSSTTFSDIVYVDKGVMSPSDAAYAWFNVQNSIAAECSFSSIDFDDNYLDETMLMKGYLPDSDLDDIQENGTWLCISENTYQHTPSGSNAGFLRVSVLGAWIMQEYYLLNQPQLYKRRFKASDSPKQDWAEVSASASVTNTYNFNEYQQTVSLTCTPTITTDTNNYLASTGDTTDRTAAILTMLSSTGTCRLGDGDFWVDSLVMPDDTAIIGSGPSTKVYVKSGSGKFAFSLSDRCTVKDLHILGDASDITVSGTAGTRSGILWQGDYTNTQTSSTQPKYGTLDNLYISRFDNAGIRCYDTGYGTTNFMAVTNCHIWDCHAGINIEYWSEFHKFTNVRCAGCYYGCINNGGNNVFVNCDFSSSTGIGFLMDNSNSQSPNNSHGSCVGCVFNHTASNSGVGIKVLNCDNGFIFDACQIFYSQIEVRDSDGVAFNSCNFGDTNCDITIANGGVALFTNNLHDAVPTITVTNNSKVHFANCYVRSTGDSVTA